MLFRDVSTYECGRASLLYSYSYSIFDRPQSQSLPSVARARARTHARCRQPTVSADSNPQIPVAIVQSRPFCRIRDADAPCSEGFHRSLRRPFRRLLRPAPGPAEGPERLRFDDCERSAYRRRPRRRRARRARHRARTRARARGVGVRGRLAVAFALVRTVIGARIGRGSLHGSIACRRRGRICTAAHAENRRDIGCAAVQSQFRRVWPTVELGSVC
ncbi:hypothetical protein GSI_06680 [Ganoderma sinense ZZ0214-1]|uniref:Uncharacterized protein n=1 Tax=Ganoderma sinense ZZ0214-1 TaxID=1077348 RepID=A0A2G8SDX7_9APHY|nr:hypothetical protein GSI_06680 [Ganoderma sinense ZZ0214-1]